MTAHLPRQNRFSIEGLDMMVPLLDEIVGEAAEDGIYAILLGMAHRGPVQCHGASAWQAL